MAKALIKLIDTPEGIQGNVFYSDEKGGEDFDEKSEAHGTAKFMAEQIISIAQGAGLVVDIKREYYTTDELAQKVDVAVSTIRNNSHKIPGKTKVGSAVRYRATDVDAALENGKLY